MVRPLHMCRPRKLGSVAMVLAHCRLAFSGGGELDGNKMADLEETFKIPSKMRGNDPAALQNPCRPTVLVTDTVRLHGTVVKLSAENIVLLILRTRVFLQRCTLG